jgi:hypothetical protein
VANSYIILFAIIFFSFTSLFHAQKTYDRSFYGGLFFLSEYIASDQFSELKNRISDQEQVDLLYQMALEHFEGDISEALLALTFACLPYNHIKVKFLFGSVLYFPLPSTPKKIFNKKNEQMPRFIFFDSPKSSFGDKDKLAHFFGNTFLRYTFGFFNLSKFMGIFVEIVEEGLFIEGGYSSRDIVVNHLGELFAESLKINNKILPSEIFSVYQLLFFRITL